MNFRNTSYRILLFTASPFTNNLVKELVNGLRRIGAVIQRVDSIRIHKHFIELMCLRKTKNKDLFHVSDVGPNVPTYYFFLPLL